MATGIEVRLTPGEMEYAANVGAKRHIEALAKGRPDKHGFEGEGWSVHIEGACGELAFAKALNKHWGGSVNTFKGGGDVGSVQVRTRSKSHYGLLVREDDDDNAAFVLVVGKEGRYRVVGWTWGGDAKRKQWRKKHGGRPAAYFVPQSALTPINA
jgi:hypothetical protein